MVGKLSDELKEKIRLEWVRGNLQCHEIGLRYGVHVEYARGAAKRYGWGPRTGQIEKCRPKFDWTEKRLKKAQRLVASGKSAQQTANALGGGCTRNMIIGMWNRWGWRRNNHDAAVKTRKINYRKEAVKRERRVRKVVSLPVSPELRSRPWEPLGGSGPVSLVDRCGCKWPVDGDSEQLFCNLPIHDGNRNGWCEQHLAMGMDSTKRPSTPRDLYRLVRRAA